MTAPLSYKDWHIPFSQDQITLRDAKQSLAALGAKQKDIPLLVQLVENPRYDIPGIEVFHGAVDVATHDSIHIILGRGLLPKDEAFVIGFTMGSTNKVTTLEERLYTLVFEIPLSQGLSVQGRGGSDIQRRNQTWLHLRLPSPR